MPVTFKVKDKKNYFISKYEGAISKEEHLEEFRKFISGNCWKAGMNELAIATDVEKSSISLNSLLILLNLKNRAYKEHNISHVKIAIYAPGDLAFGIARMYNTLAETENSPEEVRAFRNIRKAIRWLKS